MLDRDVVDRLFPADLPEPAQWEQRYPARELPAGAEVTRFGPSPTGFVHVGGLYTAMASRDLAHAAGGVFYLRIEDTDQTREIAGADAQFARAFSAFGLEPDEGDLEGRPGGAYGPYRQSERAAIYATHARELLRVGRAYPCFATREELAEITDAQRTLKLPTGYYGRWAPWRDADEGEVQRRLEAGDPYVVRFRSEGIVGERVAFTDRLRGRVEAEDNHNDVVILKTSAVEAEGGSRLPTYHFAHAVDDHLMRTSLVVRTEEWLSSVPVHRQLFAALGFDPVDYAHLAPLMKQEGSSRRKLSKRKDDEASVDFYLAAGYPVEAVLYYLRGLANAGLAELPLAEALATPLRLDEFGLAGPLVDVVKLADLAADHIATLPGPEVLTRVRAWAAEYDTEVGTVLDAHPELAARAIDVERVDTDAPRKDLAKWSDFRSAYGFFFPELFTDVTDPADERLGGLDPELARTVAADFADRYVHAGDQPTWFQQVRDVAARHGFAPNPKTYKKDPDAYPGMLRDAANVLRVAVTGAGRSPDLYEVTRALGADEVLRRIRALTAG